ncbi:cytochrome P460 family protein [Photobacterium sp. 1_MG-2023]|uniref:cytochrome P460 family protein n=1 Tax=Photobacterium sp. 1_MG-2023 TaxID=3062646 RepID=UPI0026E1C295|nr:cytochrome P460 family protein [Photobacterium sp. 1_MG-2023]
MSIRQGEISLPDDFRNTMSHLGSWYVPQGDASGFHDVYMPADQVAQYRESGQFPDGAVIVKELRHSASGAYTTGAGVSYATEMVKQTFVMIKDSQGRFSDSGNWGEGWGWALFKVGQKKNASMNYITDCLGCHIPAKQNDYVYTEGYPTLHAK